MIGKNELYLNRATMCGALQRWLDGTMVTAPTVTDVVYDGAEETFVVVLEAK